MSEPVPTTTCPRSARSPGIFEEIIYPRLGRRDPAVLVPPQHGVDIGVVESAAATSWRSPATRSSSCRSTAERSAWFAVHIRLGRPSRARPRWMTIDLNLPLGITKEQFDPLARMQAECEKLGIAVIRAHGALPGLRVPDDRRGDRDGHRPRERYVTPAMAGVARTS